MHLSPVILVLLGALNGKIHWEKQPLNRPTTTCNYGTISEDERKAMFTDFWVLGSYNQQNVHLLFLYTKHVNRGICCSNLFSLITNMDLGGCRTRQHNFSQVKIIRRLLAPHMNHCACRRSSAFEARSLCFFALVVILMFCLIKKKNSINNS